MRLVCVLQVDFSAKSCRIIHDNQLFYFSKESHRHGFITVQPNP